MATSRNSFFQKLLKESRFSTTKSGGPGGQKVNKANTKVTLHFNIKNSRTLNNDQKMILMKKLSSRISNEGIIGMSSQRSRSQNQNKENVSLRFINLIEKCLEKPKKRKATKPTKQSKERRLKAKKEVSEKKRMRRNID